MKSIIYPERTEIRNKPINIKEGDEKLFGHEFYCDIEETTLYELSDISVLNDTLFNLRSFKFYSYLTNILVVTKKKLLKKLKHFFRPVERLDKGLWITDEFSGEYFHWLTDALPRLYAIEQSKAFGNLKDPKVYKVILPLNYQTKPYIAASLEILNYRVHYYNPKKRLFVKNLITASHTAPTGNYNTEIITQLRNKLLKPHNHNADRNIYISRSKAVRRKISNEQEVIDLLLSYNYEIHCFEDYNFEQQIEIMSEARSLIGIHGAGLTNMLFMPKNGKILEFRNLNDTHNNCFFSLASSLDHNYYYLENKGDSDDTYSVNLTINIDCLKNVLKLMLN